MKVERREGESWITVRDTDRDTHTVVQSASETRVVWNKELEKNGKSSSKILLILQLEDGKKTNCRNPGPVENNKRPQPVNSLESLFMGP